jgi:catechol 2,3-dioxygenase-like lactoylglutathione lyase family enzyme
MPGIHHVSIGVNDVARAKAFYDPLMRIVGLQIIKADEESVDYGTDVGIVFSLETPVGPRILCFPAFHSEPSSVHPETPTGCPASLIPPTRASGTECARQRFSQTPRELG